MQTQQIRSKDSAQDKYSLCSKTGRKLYRRIHHNNVRILNKSKISNKSNHSVGSVALRRTQFSNDKIYSREEELIPVNITSLRTDLSSLYEINDNRQSIEMTPQPNMQKFQQRINSTSSQKSLRSYSKRSYKGQQNKYRKLDRRDIEKLLMLESQPFSDPKSKTYLTNKESKNSTKQLNQMSNFSKKSSVIKFQTIRPEQKKQIQVDSNIKTSNKKYLDLRSVKPIKASGKKDYLQNEKSRDSLISRNSQDSSRLKTKLHSQKQLDSRQSLVKASIVSRKDIKQQTVQSNFRQNTNQIASKISSYKSVQNIKNPSKKAFQNVYNEQYDYGARKPLKIKSNKQTIKQLQKNQKIKKKGNQKQAQSTMDQKGQNQYKMYQRFSSNNLTNRQRIKNTRKRNYDHQIAEKIMKNPQNMHPFSPSGRKSSQRKIKNKRQKKFQDNKDTRTDQSSTKLFQPSLTVSQNTIQPPSQYTSQKGLVGRIKSTKNSLKYSKRDLNPDNEYYNYISAQKERKKNPQAGYYDSANNQTSLDWHLIDNPSSLAKKKDKKTDVSDTINSLMLSINSKYNEVQNSQNQTYVSIKKKLKTHFDTLKLIAYYSHDFKKMYEDVEAWQEQVFLAYKKFWVQRVKVQKYLQKFQLIKNNTRKNSIEIQAIANPFILPFCRISSSQAKKIMQSQKGNSELSKIKKQNVQIYHSLQQMYNYIIEKSGDKINMVFCDDFSEEIYVTMLEEIDQLIPNLEEKKVQGVTKLRLSKIVKTGILLLFLNGKKIRNISEIITYSDIQLSGKKKRIKTLTSYDLYYQTFQALVGQ